MMVPKALGNGSKSPKMHGRKPGFVLGTRSDLAVCFSPTWHLVRPRNPSIFHNRHIYTSLGPAKTLENPANNEGQWGSLQKNQ